MKTINNNIEEQMVGFDNAILLKEKGFDVPCRFVHDNWNNIKDWEEEDDNRNPHKNSIKNQSAYYSAPTQQVAIDWIRINFGIDIYTKCIEPFDYEDKMNPYPKIVWISKINDLEQIEKFVNTNNGLAINHFHTPEEAKEAAINYALINLI